MKKFVLALAATALFAIPASVQAAPCKDAKGKFIKCATAAAPAATAAKAAPAKAAAAKATKPLTGKVRKAPCRDAKGRFMKCK